MSATQCGPDVAEVKKFGDGVECTVTVKVSLTLDEGDERIAKVRALLAQYGEQEFTDRRDIYTEEELQNARLLYMSSWPMYQIGGGYTMGRRTICRMPANNVEPGCAKLLLSSLMAKKNDGLKKCMSPERITLISWSMMSLEKNS